MPTRPRKAAISFKKFLQKVKRHLSVTEDTLEESTFYIFRTDTHQVLARGIDGYDSAKDHANALRKQHGLKWDQVSFRSEKKPRGSYGRHHASSISGVSSGARVDVASRYNPSKRDRFRGYYDKDGHFHDID